MSEENLDHFFEEFKVARKSKKLSVADVVKETKIQKEYIEAIESGNFDILSPVYIRLFIKSYCEYLKIDTDKFLKLYKEHISGKSKKRTSNETPKFIDEKSKDVDHKILDIQPDSSNSLNSTYFVEPRKIITLASIALVIIISWITLAKVSTKTHENYKIKFDNTKLEWTFFENLDLLDSQYIKLKKVSKNNTLKYEYSDSRNKILVTNDVGINVVNKIINENDHNENTINGNVQFGILNGNIKFSINSEKIDFKYLDKSIIGNLDSKKKTLLIKYYQ